MPDETVPSVAFEISEFSEGDAKGFRYTHPVYANTSVAAEILGEEVVMNLLNTAIQGRIRTKVKNDLGLSKIKAVEVRPYLDKKLATTGGLLFAESDAKDWRPDVRELTPKQLFKRANELAKKGDIVGATALFQKMQKAMLEQADAVIDSAEPVAA